MKTINRYLIPSICRPTEKERIEGEMERFEGIQSGKDKPQGFQQGCKQCETAREWGKEGCFYHFPKFKYQ